MKWTTSDVNGENICTGIYYMLPSDTVYLLNILLLDNLVKY